jgi:hypothetical protein
LIAFFNLSIFFDLGVILLDFVVLLLPLLARHLRCASKELLLPRNTSYLRNTTTLASIRYQMIVSLCTALSAALQTFAMAVKKFLAHATIFPVNFHKAEGKKGLFIPFQNQKPIASGKYCQIQSHSIC